MIHKMMKIKIFKPLLHAFNLLFFLNWKMLENCLKKSQFKEKKMKQRHFPKIINHLEIKKRSFSKAQNLFVTVVKVFFLENKSY